MLFVCWIEAQVGELSVPTRTVMCKPIYNVETILDYWESGEFEPKILRPFLKRNSLYILTRGVHIVCVYQHKECVTLFLTDVLAAPFPDVNFYTVVNTERIVCTASDQILLLLWNRES